MSLDLLNYYIDKWSELKSDVPIKLLFGLYKLAANRNYLTWGLVKFNSENLIIIFTENNQYIITKINNMHKIEVFKGDQLLFTFYDFDFKILFSLEKWIM